MSRNTGWLAFAFGSMALVACAPSTTGFQTGDSGASYTDVARADAETPADVRREGTDAQPDVNAPDASAPDVNARDASAPDASAPDASDGSVRPGADSCSAMAPCDPIAQTGCPAGQGCYTLYGGADGLTYTGLACLPAGTGGDDALCGGPSDCRPGYTCLFGTICMKFCDPAHGAASSPDCSDVEESDCQPASDGAPTCFGLCQDPAGF